MFVASWNVNSVRARLPRLLDYLQRRRPDVLCLQETKVEDAKFPHDALQVAGYVAVCAGQKSYNGVAILAKKELGITEVTHGLVLDPPDAWVKPPKPEQMDAANPRHDPQARLIAGTVQGVRVVSVYVPNGSTLEHPRCAYKLAWLRGLRLWLESQCDAGAPLVVAGDYNVALHDGDAKDPEAWAKTVLYHPSMRDALNEVLRFGLVDLLHKHHPEGGVYTWWDYRTLGFVKNNGVRIDHLMATDVLACRSRSAGADRDERKGTLPSDHVPAWAEFAWP